MHICFLTSEYPKIGFPHGGIGSFVKTIYEFQHFRSMPSKGTVIWLNHKDEIVDIILNAKCKNQIAVHHWRDCILGDYHDASKSIREKLQLN